jgi:magnesium chelatase subunit D
MTKAAYDGRKNVTEDDMIFASELTLGFRMRRTPFEEAALGTTKFQQVLDHAKKLEAEEKKKKRKAKDRQTKKSSGKSTSSKKTAKPVPKKKPSSKK